MWPCMSVVYAFLLLSRIPLCANYSLYFQSLDEGYWGCLQFWVIMSKVSINMHAQVLWACKFLSYGKYARITRSYDKYVFIRNDRTVFPKAMSYHVLIHSNGESSCPISWYCPVFIYLFIFNSGHSNRCPVPSHCSVYLYFSNN